MLEYIVIFFGSIVLTLIYCYQVKSIWDMVQVKKDAEKLKNALTPEGAAEMMKELENVIRKFGNTSGKSKSNDNDKAYQNMYV